MGWDRIHAMTYERENMLEDGRDIKGKDNGGGRNGRLGVGWSGVG